MKILFYGNCQMEAINQILNLNINIYEISIIECFSTDINENDFKKIIKKSNLIITQMIHENYRNKHYLSTKYILDHCTQQTKIIFINNLHFEYYYFDLKFVKKKETFIEEPSLYHYNQLIEYYKGGYPIEYYLKYIVNVPDLISNQDLENIANSSLNELEKRHNDILKFVSKFNKNVFIETINITSFIRENYKNKLLFYTFNHPTKFLLQKMCQDILEKIPLENKLNYDIDPFNWYRGIIYQCIQKHVRFNIKECLPLLNHETDVYKICEIYYHTYHSKTIQFD